MTSFALVLLDTMSRLLDLPPITPEFKSLLPFLQRADEVKHQEPIIAYWCTYYAAQQGMAIQEKDVASRQVLFALLDTLERMKKEIGSTDAIDDEGASSAYFENFALRVFALADNEDRQGNATRATAKKFVAAANFLEVLHTFPKVQLSENIDEKIRYSKWKAADIAKAFREGRKPTPGPAASETSETSETQPTISEPTQLTEEAGVPDIDVHMPPAGTESTESSHQPRNAWVSGELERQPSPMAVTPPPMPPKPFNASVVPSHPPTYPDDDVQASFATQNLPQIPPSLPLVPSAPPYIAPSADFPVQHAAPTMPPPPPLPVPVSPVSVPSAAIELAPALVVKVQKHCRYAISALDYEDAEQAKKELHTALELLGG